LVRADPTPADANDGFYGLTALLAAVVDTVAVDDAADGPFFKTVGPTAESTICG
jgi:hypothetical protein